MFTRSIALSGNESADNFSPPLIMIYIVIHDVTSLVELGDFGNFKTDFLSAPFLLSEGFVEYILVLH